MKIIYLLTLKAFYKIITTKAGRKKNWCIVISGFYCLIVLNCDSFYLNPSFSLGSLSWVEKKSVTPRSLLFPLYLCSKVLTFTNSQIYFQATGWCSEDFQHPNYCMKVSCQSAVIIAWHTDTKWITGTARCYFNCVLLGNI